MGTAKNGKLEARDARTEARQTAQNGSVWKGFVNVDLTDADREVLRTDQTPFEDYWEGILDRMCAGYKLSVSRDHKNDTWIASLTCNHPADANRGYTLTGRGGSWTNAVIALAYKDRVLLRGVWNDPGVTARAPRKTEFD